MDQQEKKDQIRRIFDVFNRRAIDEIDAIFHPDYVDHGPTGDVRGIAAFKELLSAWLEAFPDAHFEVGDIAVDGALAGWQVRMVGTNTGPMMGMPPTGKRVDALSVEMGRLSDDDRPIEHWTGNSMLQVLQQLGLVPDMAPQDAPAA
jgi:predicted ester cyclase